MILFSYFTFQIILLAVGLGVGYFILITSTKYEGRFKTTGEALGWFLIAAAIIFSLFSMFYSVKLASFDYMPRACPVHRIMDQEENPSMNHEKNEQGEDINDFDKKGDRPNLDKDENEDKPTKKQ